MKQIMLCTDLDRTLIPNGSHPESEMARILFSKLAQREDITLVYVTGRHLGLIEEAILTYDLPQPDFAVADVGANIYRIDQSGWHQMKDWCSHISADWQWQSHKELYPFLSVFPLLRLQEQEKQRRHKLSFYVPLGTNKNDLISEMEIMLLQADIRANIIWSIDDEAQIGLLDVLPASANKLLAIRFLMKKNDFTNANTFFIGDSGNDVDVLLSDIPSVLVANAQEEIKQQAKSARSEGLYIAQGGYLGMNGNYSAGILEGIAHFMPTMDTWLRSQKVSEAKG